VPYLFRDKTPSDPFLMSGTILKVTITAFCVQGAGRIRVGWAPSPAALGLVLKLEAKINVKGGGQECPPHTLCDL
jgi:hypothetical protein